MPSGDRVGPLTAFVARNQLKHKVVTPQLHCTHTARRRLRLQWSRAAKMQIVVVRNAFACILCAVVTNGCYYVGNIFSLKASPQQSLPELFTATLIWTVLSYCGIMLVAHMPSLMTQRFFGCPDYQPGVWFCMKKLMKGSIRYFAASMGE